MTDFKRALIALDLSAMDERMLAYASTLWRPLGMEKIYFVHIMKNFKLPADVDVAFQKRFAPEYPVDEKVRDKITQKVEAVFGNPAEVAVSVEIIEGKPYEKLIHWTEVKEIDLLVVGHKKQSKGSGITARRVARKAGCNVIFLPEQAPEAIRRIVVPIDFSDNSARALDTALQLSSRLPGSEVQALYVVDMPPGDYYMQPYQDAGFRKVLVDSAQSAYKKFLNDHGLSEDKAEGVFVENNYVNVAAHVTDYVQENEADLVILGAQGHTALENFLYGSVTENLVERCREAPILIIR